MDEVVLWQIGIGAVAFLLGLGAGTLLRRPDRRLKARLEELQGELQESRREYDQHRARVEKHFERTSELFRDTTEQYTALYSHLAQGARDLCPGGGPALGRGLNDPLLAATFGSDAPWKSEAAQSEAAQSEAAQAEAAGESAGEAVPDEPGSAKAGDR